jgi:hypothetical protein
MKCIAFFAVALFTAGMGCSSSDDTCDGAGCVSSADAARADAAAPDGPMLFGLSRGMNNYNITALVIANDGCALMPPGPGTAAMPSTLPVTYNDVTTVISIGNPAGSPPVPSLGSGMVGANMATLVRENEAGDTAGCTWHQKDTGTLVLIDHDKFTLMVKEDESAFMRCTNPPPPTGGTCTSTWTWTLQKAM